MILNCAEIIEFSNLNEIVKEFYPNKHVESTPELLKNKKFNIVVYSKEDGYCLLTFDLKNDTTEFTDWLMLTNLSICNITAEKLIDLCNWNINLYKEQDDEYGIKVFEDTLASILNKIKGC